MFPLKKVVVVGVGLLGGSVGKAVKSRGLAGEVVGIGRNPDKLSQAVGWGIIDRGATNLADEASSADLVVVCTPVETVAAQVLEVASHAGAGCLVTDVASTKGQISAAVETQIARPLFVGSHPLAGDHRSGAEFSREDLFVDRVVVVTPTDTTPTGLIDRTIEFWKALGGKVVTMGPYEHDAALGLTSHLPHLVASALALSTPDDLGTLAASGWLDTTRVAAGEAALWREIFASNRPYVLAAVEQFRHQLDALAQALTDEDDSRLEQMLAEGKRIRDAVGN